MTQNLGIPARTLQGARDVAASGFAFRGRRRTWRGTFALGFLFVTAVAGYGLIFVLIDKWYKGGTLGIF